MIWLEWSWLIVLLGAEISFAYRMPLNTKGSGKVRKP
jgi:uncharacterized BrkB/YihY/UPF0761 family membrane protein